MNYYYLSERERERDRQTDREGEEKKFINCTEVLCNVMAVTAQSCLLILGPRIQENGV